MAGQFVVYPLMSRPRVALLTSLVDLSPAYSLNNVLLDHCRMLQRAGWDYDLLAIRNFNRRDLEAAQAEGISVKNVLPQTTLVDYRTDEHPRQTTESEVGFEDQADIHANGKDGCPGYLDVLEPYDTVCTHDLMFLSWHLPQNAALRRAIDKWPEKNWLHWIHSGPSEAPDGTCYPSTLRYQAAPDSVYVFLNETQRHGCALMLGCSHKDIAVVYNSRDLRDLFSFSADACEMVDAYDLLNHEIMQVYPFSAPRWEAKGVHCLLKIFGSWKAMGIRVKLVLVNAHANQPVDEQYVQAIEAACGMAGLEPKRDVLITSRWAERHQKEAEAAGDKEATRKWRDWRHCVPHQVVRELSLLANTFVFTSESECCSLIQAEAAATGKFMVLNSEFPAMAEFATEGTLQLPFTSNDPVQNAEFYEAVAREAWSKLQTETAIMNATKARTTVYNRDWIWRRQLEPLLWRKFSQRKPRPSDGGSRIDLEAAAVRVRPGRERLWPRAEPTAAPAAPEPERALDYDDPWPGMKCSIFGACSTERRAACYKEAGHCFLKDEKLVIA